MSKKNKISKSCELFIKYSQDVLREMKIEERSNLTYLELVQRTSFLYHKKPFDDSCRKSSYRFFNDYYYSNPMVSEKTKNLKINDRIKLKIDDILPLLMYDIRKELLNNALGDTKRISVFRQKDICNQKEKIITLIENDTESTDYTYEIIEENFDDLIDCMFKGYGGLAIVFSSKNDCQKFIDYIKK